MFYNPSKTLVIGYTVCAVTVAPELHILQEVWLYYIILDYWRHVKNY